MATLQARVNQVQSFVDSCKEALSTVYRAMYPLNTQPSRLCQLLMIFRSLEDMKRCVCHQLIGGAKVALAFVRVHNPSLNFWDLHKLPSTASNKVDFDLHYAAVAGVAKRIIDYSNA